MGIIERLKSLFGSTSLETDDPVFGPVRGVRLSPSRQ